MKIKELTEEKLIEAPMGFSKVPYPGYKGKGSDFRANDEPDADYYSKKYPSQPRNYAIVIDGKLWKVVRNLNHARSIEKTLKSKGKEVEIKITDQPVSETTSAGNVAGTGNGFASGGIGTLSRAGTANSRDTEDKPKRKNKTRRNTASSR